MEEILIVKLRDKPGENMQRRTLDHKHDERASVAFMKSCTFSVKTAPKATQGFAVVAFVAVCFLLSP